jgi:hypothetical protein
VFSATANVQRRRAAPFNLIAIMSAREQDHSLILARFDQLDPEELDELVDDPLADQPEVVENDVEIVDVVGTTVASNQEEQGVYTFHTRSIQLSNLISQLPNSYFMIQSRTSRLLLPKRKSWPAGRENKRRRPLLENARKNRPMTTTTAMIPIPRKRSAKSLHTSLSPVQPLRPQYENLVGRNQQLQQRRSNGVLFSSTSMTRLQTSRASLPPVFHARRVSCRSDSFNGIMKSPLPINANHLLAKQVSRLCRNQSGNERRISLSTFTCHHQSAMIQLVILVPSIGILLRYLIYLAMGYGR